MLCKGHFTASFAVLGLACALAAPARGDVDVDIHVGIPAPPVVGFINEPDVIVVPETRVYYAPSVREYDMYRLGTDWYINREGYWYRSNSFRGPFVFIDAGDVPRHVVVVPNEYRHQPRRPPNKGKKHGKKRGHGHDG